MDANVSARLLINLVNEKYGVYKSHFEFLLKTLSEHDHRAKLKECEKLHAAAAGLSSVLATSDRPSWLNDTVAMTREFRDVHKSDSAIVAGSTWKLLQRLMAIRQTATNHSWDFSGAKGKQHYNFDVIYIKYRDSSGLDDLFDSMIDTLTKMLASGEIDSMKAIAALRELLATISHNKRSSYFSTMATWEFVKNFTCNLIWEELESVPGVKSLKKAFEKTVADTELEMGNLHGQIAKELKERFSMTNQTALTYRSNTELPASRGD